ncbi:MAG: hypothetical protein JWM86_1545 [Thermoleophilia bacterium]|nr:hypothetical protein [Thermoleophilia bacterium]
MERERERPSTVRLIAAVALLAWSCLQIPYQLQERVWEDSGAYARGEQIVAILLPVLLIIGLVMLVRWLSEWRQYRTAREDRTVSL